MAAPKGNQYGKGNHNTGRPLKFKSVVELQKKIDAYFADCDSHEETKPIPTAVMIIKRKGKEILRRPRGAEIPDDWRMLPGKVLTRQKPYTITGLAVWLDTDRDTLIRYESKEAFYDAIKRAKSKIHSFWESALYEDKKAAGVIFNLKNNWAWKDVIDVKQQQMPTGYEDLTDEELQNEIARLEKETRSAQSPGTPGAAKPDGK